MKNNFTRKQRVERESLALFYSEVLTSFLVNLPPPIQESLVKNRKKL